MSMSRGWVTSLSISFLVLVTGIGLWEWNYARIGGYSLSMEGTTEHWVRWREKVVKDPGDKIILIGASRIQLDMDLATLRKNTGLPVYQLAIDGSSFLPILEDLANDQRVMGTILISILPIQLTGDNTDTANDYVRNYYDWLAAAYKNPWRLSERVLRELAYKMAPSRSQGVRPETLWMFALLDKEIFNYFVTYETREVEADYSKLDTKAVYAWRFKLHLDSVRQAAEVPYSVIDSTTERLQRATGKIIARGGRVVFIQFPIDDKMLAASELLLPRARYWDEFTASITRSGVSTIHFDDFQELRHFNLPDGSHIDKRDQVAFTQALVDVLNRAAPGWVDQQLPE
ncbi:MAG: hypothetical protein V3T39_07110 [Gammaproteobacteria bacterium]